jgi:hypothetical protein
MKNFLWKSAFCLGLITIFFNIEVIGQEVSNHEFTAGIRIQKTHNLYFENGLTLDYTNSKLWDRRIHFGFNYFTSRWGTAFHSNALKQDNYLGTIQFNFRREKLLCPFVRLNVGYFFANLESPIFSDLPHTSALLSMEGGILFNLKIPIQPAISFGYNFITGDGLSGPGTLFPLFYQLSINYKFMLHDTH